MGLSKTNKSLIAAALAAATLAGAAPPALAYPTPARSAMIAREIDKLDNAVARNDWRGNIGERAAWRMRRDVAQLRNEFRAYDRDGLNDREMNYLRSRIIDLRARLDWRRAERNGR